MDIYNLAEPGDTASAVTTNIGCDTALGPKVIVSEGNEIMRNALDVLKKAQENGRDVIGAICIAEAMLKLVEQGDMTIKESILSLADLRNSLGKEQSPMLEKKIASVVNEVNAMTEQYQSMRDAIKDINNDAPHQQDQLNWQEDAARTLAASTHGAASHLTKTVCENQNQEDIEVSCIIRRLTTTETARLQGFDDDYTKIDGIETSDSSQYKGHGNSWATQCANKISTRVDSELRRLGHKGTIKYATVCSGIEAQSVAVKNLDWTSVFFSEIDSFPCRLLAHHYPGTPNLGDLTQIHVDTEKGVITNSHAEGEEYSLPDEFVEAPIQEIPFKEGDIQVISGGTPCTDVSVAGKREGMAEDAGTRSSLAFNYQNLLHETKPTFFIWENVPGVFSSNGGADFIWFVNKCAESGYAIAWRVLDAQYIMTEEFPRAVPQRRRRIWLVGYKNNDWRVPARICFDLKKDTSNNPPIRVPGLGFKVLSKSPFVNRFEAETHKRSTNQEYNLFGMSLECCDGKVSSLPISEMIDFKELPAESDFAKTSMADVYEFANKVGEVGFIGSVFRTDKKKSAPVQEQEYDLFSMPDTHIPVSTTVDEEDWEGAERINPAILENIGNAGILANGRICTMSCPEWSSGIELSPETHAKYTEYVKVGKFAEAKELLPTAYTGDVCGLVDVLEEETPTKYNLSWRACYGILKRAEARGKTLPDALYSALITNLRNNAGIVKWVALNGKDTVKKEGDLSERAIAVQCYGKYIESEIPFKDVTPVQPLRKGDEESDIDNGSDETEYDDDGSPISPSQPELKQPRGRGKVEQIPNGVINESGGEISPTIVSSQFKGPGNTQDGTIIAVQKEVSNAD